MTYHLSVRWGANDHYQSLCVKDQDDILTDLQFLLIKVFCKEIRLSWTSRWTRLENDVDERRNEVAVMQLNGLLKVAKLVAITLTNYLSFSIIVLLTKKALRWWEGIAFEGWRWWSSDGALFGAFYEENSGVWGSSSPDVEVLLYFYPY